jgi:hypothetical protein
MNRKEKTTIKSTGPSPGQRTGPSVSELIDRLMPPQEARKHFSAARVEILKGLRAILDARIERVSRSSNRGERITVE